MVIGYGFWQYCVELRTINIDRVCACACCFFVGTNFCHDKFLLLLCVFYLCALVFDSCTLNAATTSGDFSMRVQNSLNILSICSVRSQIK